MNCVTANKIINLGSLANIAAGYPFRGSIDALPDGGVAVIQMANVEADAGIDWEAVKRVTLPTVRSASVLEPEDVIFTTRGTRNFAVALGRVPEPAVCSPQFFVMRVKDPNAVMPSFLAWQINQRPAQEYFQREATGSYILNIRREVIENLPIAILPIAQQRAITKLAAAAHEERAALSRLITNRNRQMEAIALDLHRTEGFLS